MIPFSRVKNEFFVGGWISAIFVLRFLLLRFSVGSIDGFPVTSVTPASISGDEYEIFVKNRFCV